MDYSQEALKIHEKYKGKLEVASKFQLNSSDDLSVAYTPGVAEPCKKISENPDDVYRYTSKGNLIAVVTDGTAVLGLGDIGPKAGMPVMEGKAILFKHFANVDAIPICLDTKNPKEIIDTIVNIAPGFGGINLEDISSPRCFEIENELKKKLDIPVFHDDQHGTAVVVLAASINALKLLHKSPDDCRIVINGAGAAGIAIGKLLIKYGFSHILFCDRRGIITLENANNPVKKEIARISNQEHITGTLANAMCGADIFIGVSAPGTVTPDMIRSMKKDPCIFAMANPVPEIMPDDARQAGAKIVATGRSDFPNQINNLLAFPGIFRGALDVRAKEINEDMKLAAAMAIAGLIPEEQLSTDYIIPSPLNPAVCLQVASAVRKAAIQSGVARYIPEDL